MCVIQLAKALVLKFVFSFLDDFIDLKFLMFLTEWRARFYWLNLCELGLLAIGDYIPTELIVIRTDLNSFVQLFDVKKDP